LAETVSSNRLQVCAQVPVNSPKTVKVPKCTLIPKEECKDITGKVPDTECKDITRKACQLVPKEVTSYRVRGVFT
jgi:hypothetical protein